MDMATIDELESRMRFVEADIASEKEVSLATLQQAVRNGAALSNLRTELGATTHRIDQMVADAAVANSTLRHHSTLLTVLQQDVTAFRHDVTALRRGQEELHHRLDGIDARLDRQDARFDGMDGRLDGIDTRLDGIDTRLDGIDTRLDGIDTRLDGIDTRLDRQDARFDRIDARFDKMESDNSEIRVRLDRMEQNIAAILAAVAPGNPPPA
jgi:chromosome segregation ATPase